MSIWFFIAFLDSLLRVSESIIKQDHIARVPWDLLGMKSWAWCTNLIWWTITMDSVLNVLCSSLPSLFSSSSLHSGENTSFALIASEKEKERQKAWLYSSQTAASAMLSLCFSALSHLKRLSHDGRIVTRLSPFFFLLHSFTLTLLVC